MARQRIPGLSYIPVDNLENSDSEQCVGFNLKSFTIPGEHKYGVCRPVTDFSKLRTIAEGQFGTIYKARDTADDRIYALKKLAIKLDRMGNPELLPQIFLRQINNLRIVKHLNIVNLKEVVVGKNPETNYLVLDYCEYSLENVLRRVDAVFFQHQHIKNIMSQLLFGLQHLHRFNIIHRDLCTKNILFTEFGILKISDFGSSRSLTDGSMTPNRGLRWYRAPEILFGSTKYTKAVDIWSVGCIFAEMIRLKSLLRGETDGDVVRSLIDLLGSPSERHWPGFSKLPVPRLYRLRKQPYNRMRAVFNNQTIATVNYVQRLMKYNPASRPSVEEAMDDPYYAEHPHACSNEQLLVTLRLSKRL